MAVRLAGVLVGVVFGFVLCWSRMVDPDTIRSALLFERAYLFLFFASAVAVAAAGVALLRAARARAVLTGTRVVWPRERPARRHVVGSVIFGVGWGVANVCPGPVAAQIGQGLAWALPVLTGILIGVLLFQRRVGLETEPPSDTAVASDPPARRRRRLLTGGPAQWSTRPWSSA